MTEILTSNALDASIGFALAQHELGALTPEQAALTQQQIIAQQEEIAWRVYGTQALKGNAQ
jgi:hypothetical protein